jgi:predicted chitinase
MSDLLFKRAKTSDTLFGIHCGLVNDNLKGLINKRKISYLGCKYPEEARREILAGGISCTAVVNITGEQLKQLMPGLNVWTAKTYARLLNGAMAEFGIDTPPKRNMFLAQIAHESGNLRWFAEKSPKRHVAEDFFKKYDFRKDLGNIKAGDGFKFRGRGAIQITGKRNYEQVGKALGIDLIENPELLEKPETAMRASAFWWKKSGLNSHSAGFPFDSLGVSVRVNGVAKKLRLPNHLRERTELFIRISQVLGI